MVTRDVALSLFSINFNELELLYTTSLRDIAGYYGEYVRLVKRWECRADMRIVRLHYEDIVADPKSQLQKVLALTQQLWEVSI